MINLDDPRMAGRTEWGLMPSLWPSNTVVTTYPSSSRTRSAEEADETETSQKGKGEVLTEISASDLWKERTREGVNQEWSRDRVSYRGRKGAAETRWATERPKRRSQAQPSMINEAQSHTNSPCSVSSDLMLLKAPSSGSLSFRYFIFYPKV